jgi:hypothetical protein
MKQGWKVALAIGATSAMLAVAVTPLRAQDLDVYTPDGAWAVDYGKDYCRLVRDFASG